MKKEKQALDTGKRMTNKRDWDIMNKETSVVRNVWGRRRSLSDRNKPSKYQQWGQTKTGSAQHSDAQERKQVLETYWPCITLPHINVQTEPILKGTVWMEILLFTCFDVYVWRFRITISDNMRVSRGWPVWIVWWLMEISWRARWPMTNIRYTTR